jgi:hypothetical protein
MQTKMLPRFIAYSYSLFSLFFFYSCNEKEPCNDCEKCGENLEYGVSLSPIIVDGKLETTGDTIIVDDAEFVENKRKIEKKFGQQWDFCRCVLANDSLDLLIKNNADLDEKFMKKFDEVDQKCKAFLVMSPNKTPEERTIHEKKIKKCLMADVRR